MLAHRAPPFRPWFLEAPCRPEDIGGLGTVSRRSPVPIAAGEEWRTEFDLTRRPEKGGAHIEQPEMRHTGINRGDCCRNIPLLIGRNLAVCCVRA